MRVEVVAAVVRDRDRGERRRRPRAGRHRRGMTPLSMNGPSHCSRSQRRSSQVGGRRLHPLAVGAEERRRRLAGRGHVRTVRSGRAAGAGPVDEPARAGRAPRARAGASPRRSSWSGIHGLPQSRLCENVQSSVTIIPTAPAARARSSRARDLLARAAPVDLEERLGVGRDDLLDRLAGERAESHRRAARGGGARDRDLAVGMDGLHAGRRDDHRERDRLSHHGRGHVPLGRQVGDVRREPELAERGDVVRERDPGLGARDQRRVHRLRQPPLARGAARPRPTRTKDSVTASRRPQTASGFSSQACAGTRRGGLLDMSTDGLGSGELAALGEQTLAVAEHALGVGAGERQPGEELRRHAAAAALVEQSAARARAGVLGLAQLAEQLGLAPDAGEPAARHGRCRRGTRRGSRTGTRTRRRSDRSGTRPGPRRTGSGREARRRSRRGGRTSPRSARCRRGRAATRTARAAEPRSDAARSQTSAPRPDGRSRVSRSCAPKRSASALKSSSWVDVLARDHDRELEAAQNRPRPGSPSRAIAVAYEPGPRTRVIDLGGGAVERDLHVDIVGAPRAATRPQA